MCVNFVIKMINRIPTAILRTRNDLEMILGINKWLKLLYFGQNRSLFLSFLLLLDHKKRAD